MIGLELTSDILYEGLEEPGELTQNLRAITASEISPSDYVNLHTLRDTIEKSWTHAKTDQVYQEILKSISHCQNLILDRFSPAQKSALSKLVADTENLEELRSEVYPKLYTTLSGNQTQIHSTKTKLEHIKTSAKERMKTCPIESKVHYQSIIIRADRNLNKLTLGQTVRMANYFHATKNVPVLKAILKSNIAVSDGEFGPGAYISTKVENDYGNYIIALDRHDVQDIPLSKDNVANREKHRSYDATATWRALREPIHLNPTGNELKVAYIIGNGYTAVNELKAAFGDQIEVIPQIEALLEKELLEELEGNYEPKAWGEEWTSRKSLLHRVSDAVAIHLRSQSVTPPAEPDDSSWD